MRKLPAEMFPITVFVLEELEARDVPLDAFLNLIGLSRKRWDAIDSGLSGCTLNESQRIAAALNVEHGFISGLNLSYRQWLRGTK